ncbi:tetratricopeptide repeat protein (plasmid) [Psychrobacter celer]
MQSFKERIFYKLIILALSVGLITPAMAENKIDVVAMEKLANEGSELAQRIMGDLYIDGNQVLNVEKDLVKSFRWYEKAAKQGLVSAQNNIAYMYSEGLGVRQDYNKAGEWYRKAASSNHGGAQIGLGIMYANGEGVRQDYKIAKEWFGKACDNGEQIGCNNYRILNEQGN